MWLRYVSISEIQIIQMSKFFLRRLRNVGGIENLDMIERHAYGEPVRGWQPPTLRRFLALKRPDSVFVYGFYYRIATFLLAVKKNLHFSG